MVCFPLDINVEYNIYCFEQVHLVVEVVLEGEEVGAEEEASVVEVVVEAAVEVR